MSPRAPSPYEHWTSAGTISTAVEYIRTFLSPDGKIELTVRERDGKTTLEFNVRGKPSPVYPSEEMARTSLRR